MSDTKVVTSLIGTGGVVQAVSASSGTLVSGTSQIPWDNTKPQNTEGTELTALNLSITPKSATNRLILTGHIYVSAYDNTSNSVPFAILALFKDSEADARLTITQGASLGSVLNNWAQFGIFCPRYEMVAGATSAMTFKFRIGGPSPYGISWSAIGSSSYFNGTLTSSVQIVEVAV